MANALLTLTLNPAWDISAKSQETLCINGVHTVDEAHKTPGGKGINVAIAHAAFTSDVKATHACGVLGAEDCEAFTTTLHTHGITSHWVPTPHPTRQNIMLHDDSGQEFKINWPGASLSDDTLDQIKTHLINSADSWHTLALCGSVPPGIRDAVYDELIRWCRDNNKSAVLDTREPWFSSALYARPHLIKPNREELAHYLARPLPDETAILTAIHIMRGKCDAILLSDGPNGLYYADQTCLLKATPPTVKSVDSTGAGDTLLGAFLAGQSQGKEVALAQGAAAGAWMVTRRGTPDLDIGAIEALVNQVTIEALT